MKRLRKFLKLTSSEHCLLIKSWFLLGTIRLGLYLLPFQKLRSLLGLLVRVTQAFHVHIHRWRKAGLSAPSSLSPERIAWAAEVASRYLPVATTCLTKALTVQTLLLNQGYPAFIHIGVSKGESGQLEAHAWVESQGKIVIGGNSVELSQYTTFPPLKAEKL